MPSKLFALLLFVAALAGVSGAAGAMPVRAGAVNGFAVNGVSSPLQSWISKFKSVFDPRIAEEACMATAVYFEARSEPRQGQLAVAMVILNRTKSEHYPESICGVVYQNAHHYNACQFSFACDGKSDLAEPGKAWDAARQVTTIALAGGIELKDEQLRLLSTALNYHADYVSPRWSKSLFPLAKIGRHIFYTPEFGWSLFEARWKSLRTQISAQRIFQQFGNLG
jgi:hypothetical protein